MKTKITVNISPEDFDEFVRFAETKCCVVCKHTHKYLKRVASREMKKAGYE